MTGSGQAVQTPIVDGYCQVCHSYPVLSCQRSPIDLHTVVPWPRSKWERLYESGS